MGHYEETVITSIGSGALYLRNDEALPSYLLILRRALLSLMNWLNRIVTFFLSRNPKNYFAEVEQIAFSPAHFIPGIETSPDKMLQGRLFSYTDTHRHRLGTNYQQIPVNCPFSTRARNYQRDGPQCVNDNQGEKWDGKLSSKDTEKRL